MIRTKTDLRNYLDADKRNLGFTKPHPSLIGNEIWKFQIALRYYEYYYNCSKTIVGG